MIARRAPVIDQDTTDLCLYSLVLMRPVTPGELIKAFDDDVEVRMAGPSF